MRFKHGSIGFVAVLFAAVAPARAQNLPAFGRVMNLPALVEDTILPTVVAGGSLTVLTSLEANLQLPGESLSEVRTLAYSGEISGLEGVSWLRFSQQLRGYIDKDRDSRVIVVVDAGTRVRVLEYPFGQVHHGAIFASLSTVAQWHQGQPYLGAVTLIVQRRSAAAKVMASVGSIDATVARAPAPPGHR